MRPSGFTTTTTNRTTKTDPEVGSVEAVSQTDPTTSKGRTTRQPKPERHPYRTPSRRSRFLVSASGPLRSRHNRTGPDAHTAIRNGSAGEMPHNAAQRLVHDPELGEEHRKGTTVDGSSTELKLVASVRPCTAYRFAHAQAAARLRPQVYGRLSKPSTPRHHPDPFTTQNDNTSITTNHQDDARHANHHDDRTATRRHPPHRTPSRPRHDDHRPARPCSTSSSVVTGSLSLWGWRYLRRMV